RLQLAPGSERGCRDDPNRRFAGGRRLARGRVGHAQPFVVRSPRPAGAAAWRAAGGGGPASRGCGTAVRGGARRRARRRAGRSAVGPADAVVPGYVRLAVRGPAHLLVISSPALIAISKLTENGVRSQRPTTRHHGARRVGPATAGQDGGVGSEPVEKAAVRSAAASASVAAVERPVR